MMDRAQWVAMDRDVRVVLNNLVEDAKEIIQALPEDYKRNPGLYMRRHDLKVRPRLPAHPKEFCLSITDVVDRERVF